MSIQLFMPLREVAEPAVELLHVRRRNHESFDLAKNLLPKSRKPVLCLGVLDDVQRIFGKDAL